MRILVSNDDGVYAAGLKVLYEELCQIADVTVVAPIEEKSTTGHSLTMHHPLRIVPLKKKKNLKVFGVSGSPADCVYLGIRELMRSDPDLILSGINCGANLGQDVYYSGTVSAAREGCISGIPSLAVSLSMDRKKYRTQEGLHFSSAAKVAVDVIRSGWLQRLPPHAFLNLNVPDLPLSRVKGVRLAHQGFRLYDRSILKRKDQRGRDYYWIGGRFRGYTKDPLSDCSVVAQGYAALTPFRLDATDLGVMQLMSNTRGFV